MFLFEKPTVEGILDAKWAIAYCGILSVGVAYTLQIIAQKNVPATIASLVMSLESVFSVLAGWVILSTESVFSAIGGVLFGNDSISPIGYVGCACIFAGILISQLTFERKKGKRRA